MTRNAYSMSARGQTIMVWWAVVFTAIYGLALGLLLHMIPPPSVNWSANQIAHFYTVHHTGIRVGAVIASWCSGFMIPLAVVIGIQMGRQEGGSKPWSILAVGSGVLMSIFLMLPPLFWGVAAFTPSRAPQITAIMHELGCLTLVTTDQAYIFAWVAIVVVSLMPKTARYSPFPRWYGYFTGWTAFMFELGAFAFLPRNGPFDWRGLLAYWSPLTVFGAWVAVTAVLLLKALKQQRLDPETSTPETQLA
jgi:hypothetical protein